MSTATRRAVVATAGAALTSGCLRVFGIGGRSGGVNPTTSKGRVSKADATDVVRDVDALKGALVSDGATVWIPPDVTINTEREGNFYTGENVTLASDGGRIKQDAFVGTTIFAPNTGFRASGVRFHGPSTEHFQPDSNDYRAAGLDLRDGTHLVDNCEFVGWTRAGVSIGTADTSPRVHLRNSSLRLNRMASLGYGAQVIGGQLLAEFNSFDANRHAIAASGFPGSGYEARANVVGPNTIHHIFDVHSAGGTNYELFGESTDAGEFVFIHRNVVLATRSNAVGIRGIPRQEGRSAVVGNWFAEEPTGTPPMNVVKQQIDRPVGDSVEARQLDDYRNLVVRDNQYGEDAVQRGLSALSGGE